MKKCVRYYKKKYFFKINLSKMMTEAGTSTCQGQHFSIKQLTVFEQKNQYLLKSVDVCEISENFSNKTLTK